MDYLFKHLAKTSNHSRVIRPFMLDGRNDAAPGGAACFNDLDEVGAVVRGCTDDGWAVLDAVSGQCHAARAMGQIVRQENASIC